MLQVSETAAQKYMNEGDRYFDRNLFEEAIPHYLKELEKGKSYTVKNEARVKLASCYRLTGRFLEANEIYQKIVYASNRNNKSENVLSYANSLKSSALYEEAAEQFKQYIQLEPLDPMGPIYLESCYMAQEWLNEEDEFFVMNHEMFNTVESDFAPVYYDDGIVITSSREGSLRKFINLSDISNEAATDLYYINLLIPPDAQPEMTNMEGLNTFVHDGSATFSRNGNEVYFTRTVMGKKDRKTNMILNSLQVYHSRKDPAGNWSEPVSAFSFNSSKYSIGQPSLSADGKTIFFMSDMPGGFGETDIYYSEKQDDDSWGEPINTGRNINTFGHEIAPFIHGNDTLYFSSDTHPGMGKLDIFMSVKKDGVWGKVSNMKTPINSIGDDFGIVGRADVAVFVAVGGAACVVEASAPIEQPVPVAHPAGVVDGRADGFARSEGFTEQIGSEAVAVGVHRAPIAGQLHEGRPQIGEIHEHIAQAAGLDRAAAHHKGHADGFITVVAAFIHVAVGSPRVSRAVVGGEEDNRLIGKALRIETIAEASDQVVEVLHIRGQRAGHFAV